MFAVILGLFLPLIGFLSLTITHSIISRLWTAILACSTIFLSFILFLSLLIPFINSGMQPVQWTLFQFVPLEGIQANFTLHLDALSLLMTLIITGIGFLIHLYSIGYMDEEKDFVRYFAFLNLFIFFMLLLVLAGHLLVLFVGWEGVGLASYLLIGFWYTRPEAAQAATKAFVMNRIGDLSFLLGLILTFYLFRTGDISEIANRVRSEFTAGAPMITILALLYFIGATGKSAQLPLYSWLPDAMEGPTPVSALIHAATMVTAGVYLIVRLHNIFLLSPMILQVVGIIGGVTSLFAALCALCQSDLKRVLAFSTISQLGLMFLACGAGAFYSAMFHLTMHAFVKALLFLSAGNVVHMLHGTTDMTKMGGLAKYLPKTHWFFLIGVLALSGIPPFAAFFSKDLILEQEFLEGHVFLFYIALAASVLTAIYMTRAYCLTFLGKENFNQDVGKKIHEAPYIMTIPIGILAFFAIIGGLLGYSFGGKPLLQSFLGDIGITHFEEVLRSGFVITPETWIAILGAVLGVVLTFFMYLRFASHLGKPIELLKQQFYVNEIYERIFVSPLKILSHTIVNFFEPKIFQRSVMSLIQFIQETSRQLQHFQSGQIRSYLAWMVLGSVLLIVYFRILA